MINSGWLDIVKEQDFGLANQFLVFSFENQM